MPLIKVTAANRGNFGPVEDNLPVYSRDVNQIIESFPSGGVSGIIEQKRVNLKDVGDNIFDWVGNSSASNTFPQFVAIKWVSGTYVTKNVPGIQGTFQLSVDSGYTAGDPVNLYKWRVNGVDIVDFSGQTLATKQDVKDYILANTLNSWSSANPSGDIIVFTEPVAESGTHNGDTMVPVAGIDGGSIDFSGLTSVSGGVASKSTDFTIKMNGIEQRIAGLPAMDIIPSLTEENAISGYLVNASSQPLFSTSGDFSLPVTTGTEEDFIIDIFIIGATL